MTSSAQSSGVVQTKVTTTPKSDTKPVKVSVKPFSLRDIPDVMRNKLNWPIAAKFQENWFNSLAFEIKSDTMKSGRYYDDRKTDPAHLDEDTIKMEWALKFPRANEKYLELEKRALSNAAIKELTRKLIENEMVPHRGWTAAKFGVPGMRAAELDETCQCNFIECVWGAKAPLDELLGALGDFTMKVAAGGTIRGRRVTIERVGFYIRDTFEFMDHWARGMVLSQPLGWWGANGAYMEPAKLAELYGDCFVHDNCAFLRVTNESYREYRAKYGKGGDFIVYSDVLWKDLEKPQTILIPSA